MTTTKRNPQDISTLIELAQNTGCQMEPKANRPSELRGFCPFHEATTLTNARTLTITPTPPRYRCEFCRAQGNPISFAARLWRVSVRDAQELIESASELTPQRPPYPPTDEPRTNNSAIMTRAAAHYGECLYQNYFPLNYLAQLGVHPDAAQRAGVGYSDGATLLQYLQEYDVSQGELADSPLFLDSGGERFAGRVTIADRDHSGGAVWICSTAAQGPATYAHWPPRRPSITGLRCKHPYILGLLQVPNRPRNLVLTNDPRIYIICKAADLNTAMITTQGVDAAAIAENVARKNPRSLSIVINGRDHTDALRAECQEQMPNANLRFFGGPALSDILNPSTRDLQQLTQETTQSDEDGETPPEDADDDTPNEARTASTNSTEAAPEPPEPWAEPALAEVS